MANGTHAPPPALMTTRRHPQCASQDTKTNRGPALTTLDEVKNELGRALQCSDCKRPRQHEEAIHVTTTRRRIICPDCSKKYLIRSRMRTLEAICTASNKKGQNYQDFCREAWTAAQCPVCLDCNKDQPLILCRNGHSTCLGCHERLAQPSCPVCRDNYQGLTSCQDEISPSLIRRLKVEDQFV